MSQMAHVSHTSLAQASIKWSLHAPFILEDDHCYGIVAEEMDQLGSQLGCPKLQWYHCIENFQMTAGLSYLKSADGVMNP